jgi:hypothetical protein
MHKNPKNVREMRENLWEAVEIGWKDKTYLGRAIMVVNAVGKTNGMIANQLKQAELKKESPNIQFLND